jgi:hypothetical protein
MNAQTMQAVATMPVVSRNKRVSDEFNGKFTTATATVGNSGSRARTLKEKFIEVYAGSQCFSEVDLNVAILIHLLASERLYEVVVINKESAEEIDRLYVYEDEIIHQMNDRRIALSAACDSHKATAADNLQKVAKRRANRRISSEAKSLSALVKDHTKTTAALVKSQSSNAMLNERRRRSFDELQNMKRRRSFDERENAKKEALEGIRRKTFDGMVKTDSGVGGGRGGSVKSRRSSENEVKDEEIVKFISHNTLDPTNIRRTPKIRNPTYYFNLTSGGNIDPDVATLRKVTRDELLKDYSLLEKDISDSSVKDISFCTSVILRSLFVRMKDRIVNNAVSFQFVLFDGEEM